MNTKIGLSAECAAELYLCERGLRPLARNIRCRLGEVDLVMSHGATLVFVEVRLRSHRRFPNGAASVTVRKQKRIMATAEWFLQSQPALQASPIRFDVISYDGKLSNAAPCWIQQAFDSSD